jgi:hypothetical protein
MQWIGPRIRELELGPLIPLFGCVWNWSPETHPNSSPARAQAFFWRDQYGGSTLRIGVESLPRSRTFLQPPFAKLHASLPVRDRGCGSDSGEGMASMPFSVLFLLHRASLFLSGRPSSSYPAGRPAPSYAVCPWLHRTSSNLIWGMVVGGHVASVGERMRLFLVGLWPEFWLRPTPERAVMWSLYNTPR